MEATGNGYLICANDYRGDSEQQDFIVLGEDTRVPNLNSVKDADLKTVRRCFEWMSHDGRTKMKYCPNIYEEYYDVYRDAARYMESSDFHNYVDDDMNASFVRDIATHISQMCDGLGYSDWEIAQEAINFVQSIPFRTDEESTGEKEWPKYVIETLYDGCGDCEDKAFLLTAILKEIGFGAVLLVYDSHMAVGIAGDPAMEGHSVPFGGYNYFYVEPSTPGWSIGQIPKNLNSSQCAVVCL